ncbi:chorismate-binding protein [Aquirufa sp. ROCK2-A2]
MNSAHAIHTIEISSWEKTWKNALKANSAMALWRLPNQTETNFLIDQQGGKEINSLALEEMGQGFIAAPFEGSPYFLKADQLFTGDVSASRLDLSHHAVRINRQEDKSIFIQRANDSIEKINAGEFQKVVLSRISQSSFSNDFSVIQAFSQLCNAYPKAFISAFFIPKLNATWLCASPETLVEQDKNGIFRTIALAGTQSAINDKGEHLSVQQASWTHKEIEEQAFVSRYIIDCFKKIRLREYIENGPKTIIAGNLMHLKTEYLVDTQAINLPSLPGIMLSLLHPTSAVCGTPKEAAIRWIKKSESQAREMYSGYLGPVNFENEIHLFVNLRTVKIQEQAENLLATYYAGCGITEDSDAEKEWQETEMKCETVRSIIEKSL